MSDLTFSSLYEAVDYSLHRIIHILKGLDCVVENADPPDETISTLVGIALEVVEETRKQNDALLKCYYKEQKEMNKPPSPPTKAEGEDTP